MSEKKPTILNGKFDYLYISNYHLPYSTSWEIWVGDYLILKSVHTFWPSARDESTHLKTIK